MGLLDGLLNNPLVSKMLFGQLKGLFQEKNLEFIVLRQDDAGEVEVELHVKGESRVVTFPEGGDRAAMNSLIDGLIANRTVTTPERLTVPQKHALRAKKGGKNA